MINLETTSGLPMEVDDEYHLHFKPQVIQTGDVFFRKFSEMQPVLMDKQAKAPADETYNVYRGLQLKEHEELLKINRLEYDITIIPPYMFGDEYNKTVGHYHANIPGSTIAHAELYEVLAGRALFLLQKMDPGFDKLITVLAIEAQAGEKVIYPPNYGHIIVNIGSETLVTANWISTDYKPLYEPIAKRHGMCLYVVKGPDGQPTFIKNKNYTDEPSMRKMDITNKIRTDFGIDTKVPMYLAGTQNPKILEFLNHPAKYAVELSALSS